MTATTDRVRRAVALLGALVPLGVLLQAVTAGGFVGRVFGASGSFGDTALVLHELGANATFGLLALEGLLVLATPLRRRRGLVWSGLLVGLLLTAVIGLGYVGGAAVTVHVPLAVLTFGAALWHALVASGRRLVTIDAR